jgi:hypothetical protein
MKATGHTFNGNRACKVLTKTSSALFENNSKGEYGRRHASTIAIKINNPVITMFGQAFSAHWPLHSSRKAFENGDRYGIGQ